ncbi:hypothetical protein [Brevibacillus brevis]|uniref:hypothetical protein n=1 Tax=Brevibacillus brevis TaxID=1393 RepID=UPI000D0FD661|nr:hypothetical protein [Brevibacillus brevis]PSJ67447.1 hypothetical protein C7J99_20870 [Brevibacillus brevis]RED28433.1 hypothetical protein DES34_108300 [Brevibacillus brevis]GEC90687.1 hypothetical protein BBR01nite_30180 [Brevibacillus brevis]VEF91128.1 Uncharacterised protein [Brevibacillus brevis]
MMSIIKRGTEEDYAIGAYVLCIVQNNIDVPIGETSSEGVKLSVESKTKEIPGAKANILGDFHYGDIGYVEFKLVMWGNNTFANIALPGQPHSISSDTAGKNRVTIRSRQYDLKKYAQKFVLKKIDTDPSDPDYDRIVLHCAVNVANLELDLKPDKEVELPLKFKCYEDSNGDIITFGDETVSIPEL